MRFSAQLATALAVWTMVNVASVTIFAACTNCGHTEKRKIDCPWQPSCGDASPSDCGLRRSTVTVLNDNWGSQGCGACCTEAVSHYINAVPQEADCYTYKGCILVGAQCQQDGGQPATQKIILLTNGTCTQDGGGE